MKCESCERKFKVILKIGRNKNDWIENNEMCSKCHANVCPDCLINPNYEKDENCICVDCYQTSLMKK